MKKSERAVPGSNRPREMVPATWRRPVTVVGSCGIGGKGCSLCEALPTMVPSVG